MDEYINEYKKLSLKNKRELLLKDMGDLLNSIEMYCKKKNIKIDRLKSSYYLKNKEALFEEDYYDLLFIYMTYLKEDLAMIM